MVKNINISVSTRELERAIREVKEYQAWVERKTAELAKRLAELGAEKVRIGYANALYKGKRDIQVTVESINPGTFAIRAQGEAILFVEFGAGVKYGYGHPQAEEFGMGPGTYPGAGHWNDPEGWYYLSGSGLEHSDGNPPSRTMYDTAKSLPDELKRVVVEVFGS